MEIISYFWYNIKTIIILYSQPLLYLVQTNKVLYWFPLVTVEKQSEWIKVCWIKNSKTFPQLDELWDRLLMSFRIFHSVWETEMDIGLNLENCHSVWETEMDIGVNSKNFHSYDKLKHCGRRFQNCQPHLHDLIAVAEGFHLVLDCGKWFLPQSKFVLAQRTHCD